MILTYTSEWRNRTKAQLLDDLYALIEQRDKQIARAERAEADLADEKRRHGELRAGLADFYEHNADLVSEYWRIKVRALLDTATEEAQGAP